MDYEKHYNMLCQTRQKMGRKKLKRNVAGYCYYEEHHIVPKHENGNDEASNLVLLTAREHFIAHWLFAKWKRTRQAWAALSMMNKGRQLSSRQFEIARQAQSKAKLGKPNWAVRSEHQNWGKNGSILAISPDGNFYYALAKCQLTDIGLDAGSIMHALKSHGEGKVPFALRASNQSKFAGWELYKLKNSDKCEPITFSAERHNSRLISITPQAEQTIAYCARVSSPNQENPEYAKLLAYCIKHGHWSVFEMATMCLEIETTRAIAPQLLRHKSMSFQEFSLRYAESDKTVYVSDFRLQDSLNRQASHDLLAKKDKLYFMVKQALLYRQQLSLYNSMIESGVAKECARNCLPLNVPSKLYMSGNIRSWLTWLKVRLHESAQLEHQLIAQSCWAIFKEQLPIIAEAAQSFIFGKDL